MFDIKLYDELGEREPIRGLTWVQMTTVQSVIARLHFLLGNPQYKHKSNQVADESELTALRARVEAAERERDELVTECKILKFFLLRCQQMNYTASGEDAALWSINGEFEQVLSAALAKGTK